MIFATSIGLFAQKKYGNFTSTFFATLVIAYIIKDRIKETLKSYFKRVWDYKSEFYNFYEGNPIFEEIEILNREGPLAIPPESVVLINLLYSRNVIWF